MTLPSKNSWEVHTTAIDPSTTKYEVFRDGRAASYQDVITAWCDDGGFQSVFNGWLASSPFEEFRWETPSVKRASAISQPFEFVLINSMGLDRPPDQKAFADHFDGIADDIAVFPNLGGDAILVVPRPMPNTAVRDYGHLAAFVRKAPESQIRNLWAFVGFAMKQRLSDNKVWLSTAGYGVPWLHVRLDSQPKYYWHSPYKTT